MSLFWNSRSISAKLTRMNLLVSATALLLACLSFLGYDLFSFRQNLIQSVVTDAHIVGTNSASALLFNDPQTAEVTLSALRNSPDILSATILSSDGTPFATYERPGNSVLARLPALPPHEADAHWTQRSRILLGSRIMFQGKQVGTLYILAEISEIGHHARQYAIIAACVLLVCLITALLVTTTFRRLVAEPLIELAETAQVVSRERNYSIRAKPAEDGGELAVLVQSFNQMLEQIQERDRALQQSRDVLEEKVEERTLELTAANKELEAFSYTVAHDLRGPLDNVGNIGYLLQSSHEVQANKEARDLIGVLLRGTKKMSGLIDDLLNLSRATSTALRREPLNLSDMAASIVEDLKASEPNPQEDRQTEIVIAPSMRVFGDKGLLGVVLQNLLGNAWKYSSKKIVSRIEFGYTGAGAETVYFVRDNGSGFDMRYADRLFQPFQRLHSQSEFPGTGIGLATVRRIIARHGGKIWAQSEMDQGASFYFTLP